MGVTGEIILGIGLVIVNVMASISMIIGLQRAFSRNKGQSYISLFGVICTLMVLLILTYDLSPFLALLNLLTYTLVGYIGYKDIRKRLLQT